MRGITQFSPAAAVFTPKPGTQRYCFVIAGPPGTGKSTLLGCMADYLGRDKVLLLATLSREAESWKYQTDPPVSRILFTDPEWVPSLGKKLASGFVDFMQTLEWLHDEDEQYDGIILDSGTELGELAWHQALLPQGGDLQQIDEKNRFLPYDQLDSYLDQAAKKLNALTKTALKPKYVGVSWHIQPPKDDTTEKVGDVRIKKESSDHAGGGVEYEGNVLPMVRGRFRRRLAQQVDAMLYTELKFVVPENTLSRQAMDVQFQIQVRPNPERHTKFPGPLPKVTFINVTDPVNGFEEFLKLTRGERSSSPTPATESVVRKSLSRK